MSKYLIDTNVIVDFWRGRNSVRDFSFDRVSISVLVLSELYAGAEKSTNPTKSKSQIEDFVKDYDIKIIYIDTNIAKIYGLIRATLEKKGEKLEDFDLLIASTAIAEDKILVTNNTKHFQRIKNLKIIKPS